VLADGNEFECQVDTLDAKQANEFMVRVIVLDNQVHVLTFRFTLFQFGPEFDKNPIGVDYDPEGTFFCPALPAKINDLILLLPEFVRQVRAGVPHSVITSRASIARGPDSIPSGKYGPASFLGLVTGLVETWGPTVVSTIAIGAWAVKGIQKFRG
jgi:hypothetical protein